jgi:integrase
LDALLRAQEKAKDGPYVFHWVGKRILSLREAWASACDVAGVVGRIPHDFRRTAVRNLELAGVPRAAAMAMVGHKTESIYRRYAIVDAGTLRAAARRLTRHVRAQQTATDS